MPLPVVPLGTGSVVIAGQTVEYRSLSRDEVIRLGDMGGDKTYAEVFVLSRACSISEDEAREWRQKVDVDTAETLLEAIRVTSGLCPRKDAAGNR